MNRLDQHLMLSAVVLLMGCTAGSPPADWFSTPDQQGQALMDRKQYADAAKAFSDPMRQGVAWYRAGEFEKAAAAFEQVDTADGWFNRGNALVMRGKYTDAVSSYDHALQLRPDWRNAVDNRALAEARGKTIRDAAAHQEEAVDLKPDQIIVGSKVATKGQETVVEGGPLDLSDPAMRALWLRRVQTKPQDFLRAKFAYQKSISDNIKSPKP